MSVVSQLREIQSQSSESRFKSYEQLADKLINDKNTNAITELVQHLVSREGGDTYGRTYITPDMLVHIIHTLEDPDKKLADPMDLDQLLPLLQKLVDIVQPRADDYPDALMHGLRLLSECQHADGNLNAAATTLSIFNFDQFKGKCSATAEDKVKWLVSAAEFYLDASVGKSGHANKQIQKAHTFVTEVNQQVTTMEKAAAKKKPTAAEQQRLQELRGLQFRFKTVYARALDSDKKFIEAAVRYLELSQTGQGFASEEDLLKSLELAVTCAILSKAGPNRARVLAMLYSDSRSKHLPNGALLEKMFKERIIRPPEVSKFEKMLEVHQNAMTSTGRTVMQNSIMEHNLLAASKLYHNIRFDELGVLLNISSSAAEQLASTMIEQGRMRATIDQVEQLVEFVHDKAGSSGMSGGATGVFGEWDTSIEDFCVQIGRVTDSIQAQHPQYNF